MKRLVSLLLMTALALAGGCSDDSEIFYSISYPVVRIEADITLPTPEPEPTPEPGEGTGSDTGTGSGSENGGSDNGSASDGTEGNDGETGSEGGTEGSEGGTDDGTDEPEEPVNPLVAQIEAEVAAEAPVQVGGRYTLDFTRYNRGPLTVETGTDQGTVTGAFIKTPGATSFTCYFLDEIYDCSISAYTDNDGLRKVLLSVDLTTLYQERYPSAGLTKVVRKEYTSTPAN